MIMPQYGAGVDPDEIVGESYGAVILRVAPDQAAAVEQELVAARFSGWVTPPEDGLIVVLGNPGDGVNAGKRRGIVEVAELLAERCRVPTLALRVKVDRQLVLVAWQNGKEIMRYCSDPSREPQADRDVLDDPLGAEDAPELLRLFGSTSAGDAKAEEKFEELLDEGIDPDSVSESERLSEVLKVLGLPTWVVATGSLPKRLSIGPAISDMTRLRVGRTGLPGILENVAVGRLRKKWTPAPVITDPPSADMSGFDPLFM